MDTPHIPTRPVIAALFAAWQRAREARQAAEVAERAALFEDLLPTALRALGIETGGPVAVAEVYPDSASVTVAPAEYIPAEIETIPCAVRITTDGQCALWTGDADDE